MGKMKEYKVTVTIFANAVIQSRDPGTVRGIKAVIEKLLEDEGIAKIGTADFVIEGSEVTGVYDAAWSPIEEVAHDA